MTNNQLIKKAEKIALLQYRNYTKNFQISIRDIFMNNRAIIIELLLIKFIITITQ